MTNCEKYSLTLCGWKKGILTTLYDICGCGKFIIHFLLCFKYVCYTTEYEVCPSMYKILQKATWFRRKSNFPMQNWHQLWPPCISKNNGAELGLSTLYLGPIHDLSWFAVDFIGISFRQNNGTVFPDQKYTEFFHFPPCIFLTHPEYLSHTKHIMNPCNVRFLEIYTYCGFKCCQ